VTIDQPGMALAFRSVIPVWVLVAAGAVLVGIFSPAAEYGTWIPIVLAGGVLATFCAQLATEQKIGFVNRVMASLGGSVVILGAATAILGLIALSTN
jgi:hypothetical protein